MEATFDKRSSTCPAILEGSMAADTFPIAAALEATAVALVCMICMYNTHVTHAFRPGTLVWHKARCNMDKQS